MKRFLLIIALISALAAWPLSGQGHKKLSLSGSVQDATTKTPVPYALVSIPKLQIWAVTDENGKFVIPAVNSGTYAVEVSCLGYIARTIDVTFNQDYKGLVFSLQPDNLKIDNVVVTAKQSTGLTTASKIDRTAIDHLQAKSIADLMQLVPGGLISTPKLTERSYVAIRDVQQTDVASLSVGVVVDGVPLNEDGTMDKNTMDKNIKVRSVDTRTIPADNIESVEVITGVPSAEYGDMLSGGIVINTKAGRSPFIVTAQTDPRTKAVSLSKGFGLGGDNGVVNVDAGYLKSLHSVVTGKNAYDRYTGNIGYSNTFAKSTGMPLSFNVKVNMVYSAKDEKPDHDDVKIGFKSIGKKNSLGVNVFGTWQLNKSWITNVKYNLSGKMDDNYSYDSQLSSGALAGLTQSKETGEGPAQSVRPTSYISETMYDSKPIQIFGKLTANLADRYGSVYNNFMLGGEFRSQGDKGKGRSYPGEVIPSSNRPRDLSAIPFMNRLALFAEDKVNIPIGKTSLDLQAGVRYSMLMIDGYDNFTSLEPRFQGRYTLVNKRSGALTNLSVRGSWGISRRFPTLEMLYPGDTYYDEGVYSWTGTDRNIFAIHTLVIPESMKQNQDLKLPENTKFELGTDFTLFGIKGSVTFFKEHEKNTVVMFNDYAPMTITRYYNPDRSNPGKFDPYYEQGSDGKWHLTNKAPGGVEFQSQEDVVYVEYKRYSNMAVVKKRGVDFTLNFGRINPIRTTVSLNGSYLRVERYDDAVKPDYFKFIQTENNMQVSNPYLGYYTGGTSISNGNIRSRLNTNINFITHIPSIRLVTTLTIQCVWIDKEQARNDGKFYYFDENNEKVYGHFYNGTGERTVYRDPDYYVDTEGNRYEFTDADAADPTKEFLRRTVNVTSSNGWKQNSYGPYFTAHIKVTKQIGDWAQISFFCDNFTDSQPLKRMATSVGDKFKRMNSNNLLYFGAELRIKF